MEVISRSYYAEKMDYWLGSEQIIVQAISDDYPKYIISATPMLRSANHEGITHLHLRQFLTDGFHH